MNKKVRITLIMILFILIIVFILWKPKLHKFPYQEGNVVHHCEKGLDWAFAEYGDGLLHVNDC